MIEPEWEFDSDGKRFRRVDGCIEYEPTILTSHGHLTMRQLEAMNAAEKEKTATAPVFTSTRAKPLKRCPLRTGMHSECTGAACAWYDGKKCAQVCPHPATGAKCPHTGTHCTADCAMRAE